MNARRGGFSRSPPWIYPVCAVIAGITLTCVLIYALAQYRRISALVASSGASPASPEFDAARLPPQQFDAGVARHQSAFRRTDEASAPIVAPVTRELAPAVALQPVTDALHDLRARLDELSRDQSSVSADVRAALIDVKGAITGLSAAVEGIATLPQRVKEACRDAAREARADNRDDAPAGAAAASAAGAAAALPAATAAAAAPAKVYRDAIVGLAKGIHLYDALRFVRSIRHAMGDRVDIIIFTDDTSGDIGWMYDALRVTVRRFDVSRDLPPSQSKFHPSSYRWLFMRDWMRNAAPSERYDYVLLIDVRDTVFQGDPFTHVHGSTGFWAFLEAAPGSIAACGWNSGWVRDCFGEQALARIGGNVISCSGSSMASWDDARAYVDMMAAELSSNACERNGVDQGMHQWFVYSGALEKAVSRLVLVTNEDGWIATVQSMPSLTRDRIGRVLNARGEPVDVVHQYDRSGLLKEQYSREFVWLEPHQLNGK